MSKAVDAMALWEAYLELCLCKERSKIDQEAYQKILELRELHGTSELRGTFYELSGFISTSWNKLSLEDQYTITEYHRLDAWDWDFLPLILIECARIKQLDELTIADFDNIYADLLKQANQAEAAEAA